MMSGLARAPELQLSKDECTQLSDAMTRVNAEFDVTVLSPKAAAIINLGVVASGIFIPRVIGLKARKAMQKAAARAEREKQN